MPPYKFIVPVKVINEIIEMLKLSKIQNVYMVPES
jgi:hypothetical protein